MDSKPESWSHHFPTAAPDKKSKNTLFPHGALGQATKTSKLQILAGGDLGAAGGSLLSGGGGPAGGPLGGAQSSADARPVVFFQRRDKGGCGEVLAPGKAETRRLLGHPVLCSFIYLCFCFICFLFPYLFGYLFICVFFLIYFGYLLIYTFHCLFVYLSMVFAFFCSGVCVCVGGCGWVCVCVWSSGAPDVEGFRFLFGSCRAFRIADFCRPQVKVRSLIRSSRI